jgi:hypothetical protein
VGTPAGFSFCLFGGGPDRAIPDLAPHAQPDDPRGAGADGLSVLQVWRAAWGLADSRNENLVGLAGGTLTAHIECTQIRVSNRPRWSGLAGVSLGAHRTRWPDRARFASHSSRTGWANFSLISFGTRRTDGTRKTSLAPHALRASRSLQSCLSLRTRWAGWTRRPLWSDGALLSGDTLRPCWSWGTYRAWPTIASGNQQQRQQTSRR